MNKKLNTYYVKYSLEEYGHIEIEAETAQEAMEMVNNGEWYNKQKTPKNGNCIAESVYSKDWEEII